MRIGYISRRYKDGGKETFEYMEGDAKRRISDRYDIVKVKFLYGTIPYEEIRTNTEIMKNTPGMVLIDEPFITDDAKKEHYEKWCEWANSCKHGEYDPFRDEGGDSE